MKRLLILFFLLCALILVSFILFGDEFDRMFSSEQTRELLREHRQWAGPIGVALLVSDLLLPIPTTVVIGAMGAVLGVGVAAFWGWLGLSLAGLTGYGVARLGGQVWADKLAPPEKQAEYRRMFNAWGGLAVVLSRMMPILPEVISVLAGLYRMRASRYVAAVALGSLPPALGFAWVGHRAVDEPGLAVWAMALLMGVLWLIFIRLKRLRLF